MRELLERRLNQAKKGREFFIEMFGTNFDIDTDRYILLLTEEGEINRYIMTYLTKFLAKRNSKHITILYERDSVSLVVNEYLQNIEEQGIAVEQKKISADQIEDLLHFYEMYQFTGKLVVGSLDKPEGRREINFLDERLTMEELVKYSIYELGEDD